MENCAIRRYFDRHVLALLVAISLVVVACGEAEPLGVSGTRNNGTDANPEAAVTATGIVAGSPITFPTQELSFVQMEVLASEVLVEENGCLWIASEDGALKSLTVWPRGFTWRSKGDIIQVHDLDAQVVGRAGEPITMGGGEGMEPRASEDCEGPAWIA